MITSRSKCRPANRPFMPLTSLTFGQFQPNHQCILPSRAICTRALALFLRQASTYLSLRSFPGVIDMDHRTFLCYPLHRTQGSTAQARRFRLAMTCLQQNLDLVSLQHPQHPPPLRHRTHRCIEGFYRFWESLGVPEFPESTGPEFLEPTKETLLLMRIR